MKKLIIILIFTIGLNAQTTTIDFKYNHIIHGNVEIDGHYDNDFFVLEATLEGVRIYKRDTKQDYKFRKCDKEKCDVIHLMPKSDYTINGSIRLNPYLLNNTTPTITH